MQDIREYEKTQESLAMLRILAQSRKNLEERKFKPAKELFINLKKKAKAFHKKRNLRLSRYRCRE